MRQQQQQDMDVTFTNVLEGARQYFQGLPAAQNPSQNAHPPPTSQPYEHPQHYNPQVAKPPHTNNGVVASRLEDGSYVRNDYGMVQQHGYYDQAGHQVATSSQSYQYSRPQTQYYMNQNTSHQMNQRQEQQQQQYQQMQVAKQPEAIYHNGYQQQGNVYYPNHTKQESPVAVPPVASSVPSSSQSYQYTQSYSPVQTQTQYLSTREDTQRKTHNLPPIAALSSVNYHSKNREVVQRVPSATVQRNPNNVNVSTVQRTQQYGISTQSSAVVPSYTNNNRPSAIYQMPQRTQYNTVINNEYQSYPNGMGYGTVSYASTATSTKIVCPQYFQKVPNKPQETQKTIQTPQRHDIAQAVSEAINPKQKRESPLDLSVKTVRTSADSTALDEEHNEMIRKSLIKSRMEKSYQNGNHNIPQYVHQQRSVVTNVGAPKVDFLPNFSLNQSTGTKMARTAAQERDAYYQRQQAYLQTQQNGSSRYYPETKPVMEALPRYDLSIPSQKSNMTNVVSHNSSNNSSVPYIIDRKRSLEPTPHEVPNKIPKNDTWRQKMDQQIEQRLSSCANYRPQQEQLYKHTNQFVKPGSNSMKPYYPQEWNQTNRQYPGYEYQNANNYDMYIHRTNPITKPVSKPSNTVSGGQVDKKILSLLRNSLEHKEAQKKMEQTKPVTNSGGIQHPTMDVTAPLQPKPSIHVRQNVSPFTASSLLERTNTPPNYKFHFPRAVDSIKFETETQIKNEKPENPTGASTGGTDLDGLAAFLAARIRTKAELKQVGTNQETKTFKETILPRRKLFSKSEDDPNGTLIPSRNTTLRSSSETSVFDFPDSDSEAEMPVLERQSLHAMRKDRKSTKPIVVNPLMEERMEEPVDNEWDSICGKFVEQLQTNNGKKRGRRKKGLEPEVLAKLETVALPPETVTNVEIKTELMIPEIKIENDINETIVIKQEKIDEDETKSETGSDDLPLNKIKPITVKIEEPLSEDDEVALISKNEKSIDYSSDSDLDINRVARKLFSRKSHKDVLKSMVLRSADSSPAKTQNKIYLKKKAIYGDGSDFHPGWEEEVYRYKRSIRMPASLITVSRPHWHRMSTSLPDLDACSPAPSSFTDDIDFIPRGKSIERVKLIDNDSKTENEEASGSKTKKSTKNNKISEKNSSILDVLIERYGKYKKRKNKLKSKGPKIVEKSDSPLLATPSLGIGNDEKKNDKNKKGKTKDESMELNNSIYLGFFRKQTVANFRDTFKGIEDTLSPVLLKSRTRTETRVMKKRATIREVFGEDRPASAPPITVLEEPKPELETTKLKNKTPVTPLKKILNKKKTTPDDIKTESVSISPDSKSSKSTTPDTKSVEFDDKISIKSETMSITGDEAASDVSTTISSTGGRKKLRNIRRKFSSGFDYIRKKKKVIKKEGVENDKLVKKRRGFAPRPNPESESDIQKEIKTWVMNKGVGETHLHRAARLGYTDIIAYCLEKLDYPPSPKDNAGYTPLHEACSKGHLDIAKLLLQYGASVSESAQGGIRPLHEAAENGYVEIIRLLLSYGADPRLATYSGLTPLSLASDEETKVVLKNYIADIEALPAPHWQFHGPSQCFDPLPTGYNPLMETPDPEEESELSDIEMEISDVPLPNLYILRDEPSHERWVLIQDLSAILKIKSRDTLLRQISPTPSANNAKGLVRELKFGEFIEKAHCCHLLGGNEKVNARSTKIAMVKYTDKVKKLLGVEKFVVPSS